MCRQKVLGKYIADFYSTEAKLVIELDGSQHYEGRNVDKNAERTAFLAGYGLTVIRILNNEVNRNFRRVCEHIDNAVRQSLSQKSEDFWQLPGGELAVGQERPVWVVTQGSLRRRKRQYGELEFIE